MSAPSLSGSSVAASGDATLAAAMLAYLAAHGATAGGAAADADIFVWTPPPIPAAAGLADGIAGLAAPVRQMRPVLRGMRGRGRGAIILCAPPRDADGDCPIAAAVAGGLATLVRSIAYQYGPSGVRANLILPAASASADHIAAVALLLASPDSCFMTGAQIPVGQPVARWPG